MRLRHIGLLIGTALILWGCPDPVTYPEKPEIEFDDFYADGDIGYLSIEFTDGDGDIGLRPNMTEPPYDSSSYYHYNMYVEYWEYNDDNDAWEQGLDFNNEPIILKYRVPWLTPDGKNKALKGTIQVKMEPTYLNPLSPYKDSIRYRIKLIDRQENGFQESEWVFSPPIHNGVVVD